MSGGHVIMNWLLFFCYQSGLQWSPGPRFTDLPAGQTGTTNMLRRQDTKSLAVTDLVFLIPKH